MARILALALFSLLALGSAAADTQHLTRVLAQAAATAPAPAAAAAPATPLKATGATVITATGASMKDGKLTLKGVSPVATADTASFGAIPATLASLVDASKPGEPAYAVLSGAKGPGGKPVVAVLKIDVPEKTAMKDGTLTINAAFVPADAAAPITGGGVEAAMKAKASGPPPASLEAETVSLAVDNVAPPPAATAGDKSVVGAAIGAGIGDWACGTLCAMGGAAIGADTGNYYNPGYGPVVVYG
jgi:hypothetical protein